MRRVSIESLEELTQEQLVKLNQLWTSPQVKEELMYTFDELDKRCVMVKGCFVPLMNVDELFACLDSVCNDWGVHYDDTTCTYRAYTGYTLEHSCQRSTDEDLCSSLLSLLMQRLDPSSVKTSDV